MFFMKHKLILQPLLVAGKAIAATDRFLFHSHQVTVKPLVFFRITIGLLALLNFLSVYADLDVLFGHAGIMPAEITGLYVDELIINNTRLSTWLNLDAVNFSILFTCLFIIFSLSLVAGLFPRFSALLLLLLHTSLMSNNVFFMYGADYFIRMSLFYLLFFPSQHAFSVQALFNRYPDEKANYLIYVRFLQLHLLVVYLFSGVDKAIGYNWRNGEAVWKAINLPHANTDFNLNFSWLSEYPLLLIAGGWGIILTEMLYPLIFLASLRKYILRLIVIMHLSIALVLNLYYFSALMITWNIAAFYVFDKKEGKNTSSAEG